MQLGAAVEVFLHRMVEREALRPQRDCDAGIILGAHGLVRTLPLGRDWVLS